VKAACHHVLKLFRHEKDAERTGFPDLSLDMSESPFIVRASALKDMRSRQRASLGNGRLAPARPGLL
jgi:hypothetical protein